MTSNELDSHHKSLAAAAISRAWLPSHELGNHHIMRRVIKRALQPSNKLHRTSYTERARLPSNELDCHPRDRQPSHELHSHCTSSIKGGAPLPSSELNCQLPSNELNSHQCYFLTTSVPSLSAIAAAHQPSHVPSSIVGNT